MWGAKLPLLKLAALAFALAMPAMAQDEAAALFKARCARCHGLDGSSKTVAGKKMGIPDLRSAQVQHLSDDQLFETIAHGKDHRNYPHVFSDMGLSDRQVRSLVKHLRYLAAIRH